MKLTIKQKITILLSPFCVGLYLWGLFTLIEFATSLKDEALGFAVMVTSALFSIALGVVIIAKYIDD